MYSRTISLLAQAIQAHLGLAQELREKDVNGSSKVINHLMAELLENDAKDYNRAIKRLLED